MSYIELINKYHVEIDLSFFLPRYFICPSTGLIKRLKFVSSVLPKPNRYNVSIHILCDTSRANGSILHLYPTLINMKARKPQKFRVLHRQNSVRCGSLYKDVSVS